MKAAIIGAGKMGRMFAEVFLSDGIKVIASDKYEESLIRIHRELGVEVSDTKTAVRNADKILICVPLADFKNVVREIAPFVRSDHVIMDICTFKEFPVQIMHKYIKRGVTLGTHPFFSPFVKSLENQNFALTPTNYEEERFARIFKRWLEGKHAKAFIMSPRSHDRFMTIIVRLPHLPSAVLWETNKRFPVLLRILYLIASWM